MKKNNSKLPVVAIAVILAVITSCTREFTPLPKVDEKHLIPSEKGLVFENDSLLIEKAKAYIDALEFSLASQEIKELSNKKIRDSIQNLIEETEAFADNYLLFTLNDLGKKEYIHGKERIQFYRKNGYLDYMSESGAIRIRDVVKQDVVAFFNFQAFPNVKEVSMKCANAEYIDFSGLNSARTFYISDAKNHTVFNFENLEKDIYIALRSTPNAKVKVNPKSKIVFSIANCNVKSLSEIGVKNLTLLFISGVKLVDNKLFKELNPDLKRLTVGFGGGPETDAEGITYHPPVLDDHFISSMSQYAPNVEQLTFYFKNINSFHEIDFEKVSKAKLSSLDEMTLYISDKEENVLKSRWKQEIALNLPHCTNLKKISIDGTSGSIYAHTLDLSKLNTQNNPQLKKITIRGYFEKLILPNNSSEIHLDIKARELKKIVIPEQAKGKHSIEFRDYNDAFGFDENIALDWEYLRKNLKSVTGYFNVTPPASYIPYNKKEKIYFSHPRLDFSGDQWKDFEGKVIFSTGGSGGGHHNTIKLKYIDFGHLTDKNLANRRIVVRKECVVKNIPHGVMIVRM